MAQEVHNDLRITDQFDFQTFWAEHGKKITIAAAAILATGGVLLYRQYQSGAQAEQAASMLENARDTASLEQVIHEFPKSSTAAEAMSRLADVYYQNGKYAEATSTYEGIMRDFPTHPLAESAKLGLASILESQGNTEGAKAKYLLIINSSATSYIANAARMGLARCSELQGQKKEAKQLYEEILALGQNSPWFTQAYVQWVVLNRDTTVEKPTESVAIPASPSSQNGLKLPSLAPTK